MQSENTGDMGLTYWTRILNDFIINCFILHQSLNKLFVRTKLVSTNWINAYGSRLSSIFCGESEKKQVRAYTKALCYRELQKEHTISSGQSKLGSSS